MTQRTTQAYLRLREQAQSAFDFAVVVCHGVPSLKRQMALVKNGQTVTIWNEDGGTMSDQAYKNIPFYLSSRGYGLLVNTPNRVDFQIATERVSQLQFSTPQQDLDYYLFYGPEPRTSPDLGRIVNDHHYARLDALLDDDLIVTGGRRDASARYIEPTVLDRVPGDHPVMQEEIFGPILPVKTYRTLEEALDYVRVHERPLALYYFDEDERRAEETLARTISGGACVNDTLVHFAQERLPFGGVGHSGMGAYHGEVGFQTFSHARSVLVSSPLSAARQVMAPPYGKLLDRAVGLMTGWIGKLIG